MGAFVICTHDSYGQRKVEKLGRGVVAVNLGSGVVHVSWRFLVTDPDSIGFNVYRSIGGATATKLNTSVIKDTTDFTDASASTSSTNSYYVKPVLNGVEGAASGSFTIPGSSTAKRYFAISLQSLTHYSVQHIYPADLDGDGEYDYIVKRLPVDPSNNVMIEAYKNDGTFMWRVDLGKNIEQGVPTHNPFVLAYDFDSDGKAEVLIRSSEGTVFADGTTIGDVNGDGISDYRTLPVNYYGYMLLRNNCPEFLSMVKGTTGAELARTDWIARGDSTQWTTLWGDNNGHRMSMQFIGVAYLDGIHPSIVGSRGPGELMDVKAWDYSSGAFTTRWTWSARNNSSIPSGYHWADFHNIRIGDLDGDGKDEISWGVNAMDDNGTPLYYAKDDIGHGDRFVIADLNPNRTGLECYAIQQSASVLAVLYDAKDGSRLKTWSSSSPYDVSRGDAGDIDPRYKGMELWSYAHSTVLDCEGDAISEATTFPHPALSIWWDGDLLRENLDAADGNGYNPIINKWNYSSNTTGRLLSLYNEGGSYSTKSPYAGRVALYGDVLGDWREEIFCMNSDSTEIRIFSSWLPTTNRLYCLMQNPEYRACIGPKGYLPSTEVDYYLGVGMTTPPTPPVLSAKSEWVGGSNSNTWDISTTKNWQDEDETSSTYTDGDTIMFDIAGSDNLSVTLNASVNPGYFIVNTPVNYTITGSGSIAGTTQLLKSGEGSFAFGVPCTYTGATKIQQGNVYFNSSLTQSTPVVYKDGGIGGSGTITKAVTFKEGASVIPGTDGTVGTLTFSDNLTLPGNNKLLFDITSDSTNKINPSDQIVVNGNLVLTDTNYIVVTKVNSVVKAGTYPLISYTGTFTGNLSYLLVSGLSGQKVTLSNTGGVIYLTVQASRSPETVTWAGVGTKWDLLTSVNWLNNGVSEVFVTKDTVIFDATGSGEYNVNIAEDVTPGCTKVDVSSNDYNFSGSGVIKGTGSYTQTGSGTVTMSTSNTFTGKVSITNGTFQFASVAAAGTASPLGACTDTIPDSTLLSTAKLKFTGTGTSNLTDRGMILTGSDTIEVSASSSAMLAITGRLKGNGNLVKTGSGILLLQPVLGNSYTGNTIIKKGTLSFGSTNSNMYGFGASTDTVKLQGGTWSLYNNTSTTDYTSPWCIKVDSASTIKMPTRGTLSGKLLGSADLNVVVLGTRGYFKGDWSSYTGTIYATTSTSGYEFRLGNTSKGYASTGFYLGSGVIMRYVTSNGSDSYSTGVSIGALGGVSGSTLTSDVWTIGAKNTNTTFAGTISGYSITKVGTGALRLTGANTYTGGTTVSAGILAVNNTSGSGTGTGAVTVGASGTLAGTGIITGAVTVSGTIAPGDSSIGTLVISNSLTLNSGSYTIMEVNKTSDKSDTIRLTGAIKYNGTLTIVNSGSTSYASGQSFQLFNAGSYSGAFTTITPSSPGTNMVWDTTALRTTGTISISSTTGLDNLSSSELTIAPNPVKDKLEIKFSEPQEDASFEIYSLGGNLILKQNITDLNTSIDMSGYASGMYIVKVFASGKVKIKQIVKQ